VLGCASQRPTPYAESDGEYGRQILSQDDKVYQGSLFLGNSRTSVGRAHLFSQLAALEECAAINQVTVLGQTIDASKEVTYTKVNSFTYGHNPVSFLRTYSYPVTLQYPKLLTLFRCAPVVQELEHSVKFEKVSRDLVAPYTKDFRGGLLVDKGASSIGLQADD